MKRKINLTLAWGRLGSLTLLVAQIELFGLVETTSIGEGKSWIQRSFFQAAVVSILLYGCTTWMLNKRMEKKLDGNNTRMLRGILNKSWRQHHTKHQLYGHLPPIMKTIKVRRTKHAVHCWRSRDELTSDVFLWTPSHGRAKEGRPARPYIHQLCEDKGCSSEDLPEAMNDWERARDICAGGTTWWCWWWWSYILLGGVGKNSSWCSD